MSDAFFLADDAIKRGGSSAAEDDREKIKGWSILMGEVGGLPGEAEMSRGNRKASTGAAGADLAWFGRK